MSRPQNSLQKYLCYYPHCSRNYQSLANLIRHINSFHILQVIYQCPLCFEYLTSLESFNIHSISHKPQKKKFRSTFKLSEHYQEPIHNVIPINLLSIPVLPQIEESRKVLDPSQKLPITPEILSALLSI